MLATITSYSSGTPRPPPRRRHHQPVRTSGHPVRLGVHLSTRPPNMAWTIQHGMNNLRQGHPAFAVDFAWVFILVMARTRQGRRRAMGDGTLGVALVPFPGSILV